MALKSRKLNADAFVEIFVDISVYNTIEYWQRSYANIRIGVSNVAAE
jgi:hypothetical protein